MSGIGILSSYPVEKFRELNGPLLDVRSPIEFNKGHWPGATNIPLFSNEEREEIGKTYKNQGRNKAILLALKRVTPNISKLRNALIEAKTTFEEQNNNKDRFYLRLYCWRGGMRSASILWLADLLELNPVMLSGGYKAYRHWALKQFEKKWSIKLLGGKTGTGKTDVLLELEKHGIPIINLEGIANHRGSSFGSLGLPIQPSTEHFENLIAEDLQKYYLNPSHCSIWIEAESISLGRCRIPNGLFNQMKAAPVLEIARTEEERIAQLISIYACQDSKDLEDSTLRISKRLGPQRTANALNAIKLKDWRKACIAMLDYYDRCYEHELSKSKLHQKIDLSGQSSQKAALYLIERGLIN